MTTYRNLLEATKVDRGFIGGTDADRLPHLTLTEACDQLPCIIVESQIGLIQARHTARRTLQESAGNAVLLESTFTDLRARIDSFFERILTWIRSIIAKLKVQIDRITMSGKDLYARYADKLGKDADYHDLTFNGYKFMNGKHLIDGLRDDYDANIEQLVKTGLSRAGVRSVMLPRDFAIKMRKLAQTIPEGETISAEALEDITEDIDEITDLSKPERSAAMASVLANRTLTEGWNESLHRQIWGEKGEIRYGTDMFHPKTIGQILKADELRECKEGYEKLEASIKDYRNTLKAELTQAYDTYVNTTDAFNLPGNLSTFALINRYYNAYISCVGDALDAATTLRSLKINYYVERHRQAVAMLVRMVTKDSSGTVNDSFGADDFD